MLHEDTTFPAASRFKPCGPVFPLFAVFPAPVRVSGIGETRGARVERGQADHKLAGKLLRVASGVRADPASGEDCEFLPGARIRPDQREREEPPAQGEAGKSQGQARPNVSAKVSVRGGGNAGV